MVDHELTFYRNPVQEQPINAIGLIGWTKSSIEEEEEKPVERRSQTLPRSEKDILNSISFGFWNK